MASEEEDNVKGGDTPGKASDSRGKGPHERVLLPEEAGDRWCEVQAYGLQAAAGDTG